MTSPTDVLQAVLDGLPAQRSARDRRARAALQAALEALQDGQDEQHALEAAVRSLQDAHHSRSALQGFSLRAQKGQG